MPTFLRAPNLTSFVAIAATLLAGCSDKAQPDFQRCNELQTAKKYDEAREACERAVASDPESKSGKLAAARLPVLATESRKAAQAERANSAAFEVNEAKLMDLKRRFDAAAAQVEKLQTALGRAAEPTEKSRLEAELATATGAKNTLMTELRGGKAPSGRPCSCPPGDPLCSCL